MKMLYADSVGEGWIKYLKSVRDEGRLYYDEDEEIIELEDIVLSIKDDIIKDEILDKYADKHIEYLYLKKMQTTEIVKELNASYGKRIFDQLGVDQYKWVLERLKRKPETKAATMSLLLPNDPGPRIPCLDIIDFKLRHGKLFTKTFFRSQNVLRAYGNLRGIFWLSNKLAKDLEVKRESVTCFISNGHFNKTDLDKVNSILREF